MRNKLIGFMILCVFCGLFISSCKTEVEYDEVGYGDLTVSPIEITTITFGDGDSTYIIDAEGFKSLTTDEALKIAAAINLFFAGSWYSDDLSTALVEAFIPERFKENE